jgi:hypothetical protein
MALLRRGTLQDHPAVRKIEDHFELLEESAAKVAFAIRSRTHCEPKLFFGRSA